MPLPDDLSLPPEARLREVAAILAAGVLRLRARHRLAAAAGKGTVTVTFHPTGLRTFAAEAERKERREASA